MTALIEAVYENGVLKSLADAGFKEHQRDKAIFEEPATESLASPPLLDRDNELMEETRC